MHEQLPTAAARGSAFKNPKMIGCLYLPPLNRLAASRESDLQLLLRIRFGPVFTGKFCRCLPRDCRVGSLLVIEVPPRVDLAPSVVQRQKSMLIQALLPEPAVEAFNQGVVRRCAAAREVELDAVFISPSVHDFSRELTSIVDFDGRYARRRWRSVLWRSLKTHSVGSVLGCT